MARLPEKPEPFRSGDDQISARALNSMVAAIARQLTGGTGTNVQYYGDRIVLDNEYVIPVRQDVTDFICQFIVMEEYDDYLMCIPFVQPVDEFNKWYPYIHGNITDRDVNGNIIFARGYPGTGGFPLLTQNNEYLRGARFVNNVVVYVAKPWDLRLTSYKYTASARIAGEATLYNNVEGTYNINWPQRVYTKIEAVPNARNRRIVSNVGGGSQFGRDVDNQIVSPPYITGCLIEARIGVTGVQGPDPGKVHVVGKEKNDSPIFWTDMNSAGRSWSSENRQLYARVTVGTDSTTTRQLALTRINQPDGKVVRAFACSIATPDELGNILPNQDTGGVLSDFGAGPMDPKGLGSSPWLVPVIHGNVVYPNKWYPCWRGPIIGYDSFTRRGAPIFYTEGEKKRFLFQAIGGNTFKMVKLVQFNDYTPVEDEDYFHSAYGSWGEWANFATSGPNQFYVDNIIDAGQGNGAGIGTIIGTKRIYEGEIFYRPTGGFMFSMKTPSLTCISASTPLTPTSPGVPGTFIVDTNYIYVCVADNTWRRITAAAW